MFNIVKNEQYNSIEVIFDGKPSEAVRDTLKARRFRWNGKRGLWYGYGDADELAEALTAAENGGGESWHPIPGAMTAPIGYHWESNGKSRFSGEYKNRLAPDAPAQPEQNNGGKAPRRAALAPLWERCSVADIPEHNRHADTKTICAETRAHLKARFPECKFSVRCGGSGWARYNEIIATVESAPYEQRDETVTRCGETVTRRAPGEALAAVLAYCEAWLQSYNYDNSDPYTDYFDVNFYGNFEISGKYQQTEATAEQAADVAAFMEAKAAHEAAEEKRRAAEMEQREREREAEAAAAKIKAEQDAKKVVEISAAVEVEDIPEQEQRIFSGLYGGIGKERNIDELRDIIAEKVADGEARAEKAVISRAVRFPSVELFNDFCGLFMYDFDFLAGRGGYGTEDPRVTSDNADKLSAEQREAVEWIMHDCVAVYCGDNLRLVIDPEGFGYARYVFTVSSDTESTAESVTAYRERITAAAGDSFYFPAPVAEQIEKLTPGEDITVIAVNPWTSCAEMTRGKLEEAKPERYAQHTDAVKISYKDGRKLHEKRIYNGGAAETVIFSGNLPEIPREMLYTRISDTMERVNYSGEGVRDFIKSVIKYYAAMGYTPAVDTVQR